MNPFKYGQVVSADDFCPRPRLMKDVMGFMKSGQNIVIQGERRVGKTSLIHEALRRLGKRVLYVDLLEIRLLDDLCSRLAKGLIALEQRRGLLERALRSLSHLKPAITIDPITGQPSISLNAAVGLEPQSLEGLLDLVQATHRRKALVVVLDEFQDILLETTFCLSQDHLGRSLLPD